jgi:two-component system, OmpR family, response regulator QseB
MVNIQKGINFMARILIAEDEPLITAFLEKGLRSQGYTVENATKGEEIIEMALSENFDLLLLDLGLPVQDGFTILEQLRGQGATLPVIILTARDEIKAKVAGLEGGADDYVTKPFRFEELLARIRLRLKSRGTYTLSDLMTLQVRDLVLNLRTHRVQNGGKEIELSLREFTLLETLMSNPGQILSRELLLDRVWGYSYDPGSNIVDVYIGYLRKKFGSNLIETVRGMGYRFRN